VEEKLREDRELKCEHEAEHSSHHARFGLAFRDFCLKLRFHIGNLQVETVLGGPDLCLDSGDLDLEAMLAGLYIGLGRDLRVQ
jgi:hypothetical protein